MQYLLLIGVVIIVIGFILKLDPIAVVLTAAIVTGLVAKKSFNEILTILGTEFVQARNMSLFFLILPVVGLSEKYGLKESAMNLIQKAKVVTTGKLLTAYMLFRQIAGAASLRIGGHAQFIRPLIHPMAEGAAKSNGELDEELTEKIKAASAAVENYGNFFGQNLFPASAGVLLVVNAMQNHGITANSVVKLMIPISIIAFIVVAVQMMILDKQIKNKIAKQKGEKNANSTN